MLQELTNLLTVKTSVCAAWLDVAHVEEAFVFAQQIWIL